MEGNRIRSLNWLRVFEAAARCESFADAARQLNMTPPAVSQQIKALEQQVGATLFKRHAHSVELTPMGRAFLPGVQHAITSLETTAEGLFGRVRQETLYVQSVLIFAMGFLAQRVSAFQDSHPDINLQLTTGNYIEDFNRSYCDLQIVFGSPASVGKRGDRLLGERLFPVATPAVAQYIETPEDLLDHSLIEVATHSTGWIDLLESGHGSATGAGLMFVDSTVMGFALAANGTGVALARSPISDPLQQMFGLKRCVPELELPGPEHYHLVYPERATLRPSARAFRDWLMEAVADPEGAVA